jgi:hypothetical protein
MTPKGNAILPSDFRKIFVDKVVPAAYTIERNSTGAAVGRTSLPMIASTVPAVFLERSSANAVYISLKSFRLQIEHVFCVIVRAGFNSYSGETNALASSQFSRQRKGSRSQGSVFSCPRQRPGPFLKSLKALGISVTTASREQLARFEKGCRVSL